MSAISLKEVSKTFGTVKVLKGINLEVKSGEFMVFVGPSGCGKSTLLRSICGLEKISSGVLSIDDAIVNDVPPSQRGIAMVFQSYALYPHMSVFENIGFALENQKLPKAEIRARVNKVADLLQLTPYLARLPKALSGGQRQRVAIGRAIVRGARVFLFDEPLSNLDAALRVQMRLEIAKLHHSMPNTTMIYVTHDQVEAMTLADRICVLRDGLVEQVGSPIELYEKPVNRFVAGFIGSPEMNILEGEYAAAHKCHAIGIRAEHLEVTKTGPLKGKVIHTEVLGSDSYIFVDVGGTNPIIVRENGTTKHTLDKTVSLTPLKGYVHRFDKDGRAIYK